MDILLENKLFALVVLNLIVTVILCLKSGKDIKLRDRLGVKEWAISNYMEVKKSGLIHDIHSYQQKLDKKIHLLMKKCGYYYIDKSTEDIPRLEKIDEGKIIPSPKIKKRTK